MYVRVMTLPSVQRTTKPFKPRSNLEYAIQRKRFEFQLLMMRSGIRISNFGLSFTIRIWQSKESMICSKVMIPNVKWPSWMKTSLASFNLQLRILEWVNKPMKLILVLNALMAVMAILDAWLALSRLPLSLHHKVLRNSRTTYRFIQRLCSNIMRRPKK